MPATYELWLTDDKGMRISDRRGKTLLDNVVSLSASRVVNGIGTFALGLPPSFDTDLIKADRMVQVWRAPEGGRLGLWRVYFVRKWRFETTGGRERFAIFGPDVNDLLRRRVVAAYAGHVASTFIDTADDGMKQIVTYAEDDTLSPAPSAGSRAWADLSVQADLSNGPSLKQEFSWENLLTPAGGGVLAKIAQAAREAGTEVFFDIVTNAVTTTSINFEFRTYTAQRGQDVTDDMVFDQERGNLKNPFLEYDYSEETNFVYAGGQMAGAARNIQQVYDSDRYGISQWNRCEAFVSTNASKDNAVREAGRQALEQGRPRRRFGGIPVDTEESVFGLDWNFGDKVRARYRGVEFDSIIRAVVLSVNDDGEEQVHARLEYED